MYYLSTLEGILQQDAERIAANIALSVAGNRFHKGETPIAETISTFSLDKKDDQEDAIIAAAILTEERQSSVIGKLTERDLKGLMRLF